MNKEGTIYTVIFVFIVSFAFVFLLSLTNQATIERVELNQELVRQRAVLSALGIQAEGDAQVQEKYRSVAADVDAGLYAAAVNGRMVYATQFAGPGLWGTIEGVLAVTDTLDTIIGLEILGDNETPGLGGRINEAWFKDQFKGERVGPAGIEVTQTAGEGDPNSNNGIIDGVTGATRTSDSIESIVNATLERLRSAEVESILKSLETSGGRS